MVKNSARVVPKWYDLPHFVDYVDCMLTVCWLYVDCMLTVGCTVGHSSMSAALGSEKSAHTKTHTNKSRSASTTQGETQGPRDRRGKQYSCSQDKEKDSEEKQNHGKKCLPPAPKSMLKLCCMPPFKGSQGRTFAIQGSVFFFWPLGPMSDTTFCIPPCPHGSMLPGLPHGPWSRCGDKFPPNIDLGGAGGN